MKKLLILLFSLLISFNSYGGLFDETVCVEKDSQLRDGVIYLPNKTKPFSGKNLCKYESGQNKSKGKIKDGKKNELWTEWEENGQIKFKRTYDFDQIVREKNYQNGKEINDTSFSFNEKGQLETKGYYKDGNLFGETKYFIGWEIYQLVEANYKDGQLDGKTTYWFKIGEKTKEEDYKEDKLVRSTNFFSGKKTEEEDYKEDKLVRRISFFRGLKSNVELFKDGMKHGTWTTWNEKGNKTFELNFKKGKQDGIETYWWNNDKKRKEANYKDGQLDGKTTLWHKSGEIKFSRIYKSGICVSGDCPE